MRQSDGVSYTVSNTAKNKQVIFHIDPAKLDINNGFCCLNKSWSKFPGYKLCRW
ncbi:hypothetical protein [Clostridium sp.]|uniref:hypothetical protein n=1 Tax=Clostridium sp. TaxID=1506 RepID=UPI0035A06F51